MQLPYGYDEPAQIQDAVKLVATALDTLLATGRSLTPPPASCRETVQWDSGKTLFEQVPYYERDLGPLHMSSVVRADPFTGTNFSLGSYEKFQSALIPR